MIPVESDGTRRLPRARGLPQSSMNTGIAGTYAEPIAATVERFI